MITQAKGHLIESTPKCLVAPPIVAIGLCFVVVRGLSRYERRGVTTFRLVWSNRGISVFVQGHTHIIYIGDTYPV